MKNLDDINEIRKIDKGNALESINNLPKQCEQALLDVFKLKIPSDMTNIQNVVIAGMGGSAYGARIIKTLYQEKISVPVELVTDYELPSYVGKNTLVILSSYSGTTEETLNIANKAKKIGSRICGLTSGGPLSDFLKENNFFSYIFDPKFNPSKQPRLGQGYMQVGILSLFSRIGLIPVSKQEFKEMVIFLSKNNPHKEAKRIAKICIDSYPVLISGSFLEGALHAIRNPFNETAKHFASYYSIPELNHHLLEGLSFPKENKKMLKFIFFNSHLYSDKISLRMKLTKDVVMKNKVKVENIILNGSTKLAQTFEVIQLGSLITFYLGILHGVDPSKIPWVDYFKEQLKKK